MSGLRSSHSIYKALSLVLCGSLLLAGLNNNGTFTARAEGGSVKSPTEAHISTSIAPDPSGYNYDFGTGSSPIAAGYASVTEATAYAPGGYGWTDTSSLESRDRGAPADDLKRDFVMDSSAARTFKTDLPNGTYAVTVTMGDNDSAHDKMVVSVNGITVLPDVDSAMGAFAVNTFNVTVTGGTLSLQFSDAGGVDPTWIVNGVSINTVPPPTSKRFDFGTGTSPVASGYAMVTEATAYAPGGYGWTDTSSLESRDRGAPADDLKRDFVMDSSAARTFQTDLPNGTYAVTVTMGDNDYAHDNMVVSANGITVLPDVDSAMGAFAVNTFNVTVMGGTLSLQFSDAGGVDPTWVVNGVSISTVLPPTSDRFDFGTSTSPVASGYTRVTRTTAYAGVYGWTVTSGLVSRDRGSPDALRRDFVFGTAVRTFRVALPNGSYSVIITMGDQTTGHDNMRVRANGVIVLPHVITAAGQFKDKPFNVTVSNGSLALEFSDIGGPDWGWVVDAITITPTTSP